MKILYLCRFVGKAISTLGAKEKRRCAMDYIFMTRPFWLELNVPKSIVRAKYKEFFGENDYSIENRAGAITLLSTIIGIIQDKMVLRMKCENINLTIKNLYKILDECFYFYMRQKEARHKISELNVGTASIGDTFEQNRNMSRNVIDAVNLWIENCVLYQTDLTKTYDTKSFDVDFEMFLDMYIYGLASQSLSLLSMSQKFDEKEMFYGLSITPNGDIPAEVIKYHPIIFFNTLLTGNQNVFNTDTELKHADESAFGKGFFEEYHLEFINALRVMSSFQKYMLLDGKVAMTVIDKDQFIGEVERYSNNLVDGNTFFDAFVLTKENVKSQVRKDDPIIWMMNSNKYRHELRPFICLDNDRVNISYCAIKQAKHLWVSIFNNGGMSYSNCKDILTAAIEKRNEELSVKLVDILRKKLRDHYTAYFDEIDVQYNRIFGNKSINYGDFDLIFYCKETNELFLIEAKFFSDSLNNSGVISDYEKLYKADGYYDHCRRRYDLVLSEPQKIKTFIGAQMPVRVHFLFVSSKPLDIEFQDDDGVVSFPCLSIFDKYLEGKLIVDEDDSIMRPTHII